MQRKVIIGDEMGLGKTVEALAVLAHLRAKGVKSEGADGLDDVVGEIAVRLLLVLGDEAEFRQHREVVGWSWFHTGDGAEIGDDDYVTIKDRKKDVIITGGENVSSFEVEDVLFSIRVAEVAVIGVPSEKWGETDINQTFLQPAWPRTCVYRFTSGRIGSHGTFDVLSSS